MRLSQSFVAVACILSIASLVHSSPVPVGGSDASRGSVSLPPATGDANPTMTDQQKDLRSILFKPMAPASAAALISGNLHIGSKSIRIGSRTRRTDNKSWEEREAIWRSIANLYLSSQGLMIRVVPGEYSPPIIPEPESAGQGTSYYPFNRSVPVDMRTFQGSLQRALNLGVLGHPIANLQTAGEQGEWIRFRGGWYLAPGWYDVVENQIV